MTAKEIVEQLNTDNVIQILDELGSPCYGKGTTNDGQNYLMFRTICHGGDSENKLYWYENTKMFYCYTCCGAMSIFDLVKKVRGFKDFKSSASYVCKKLGISFNDDRNGIKTRVSLKEIKYAAMLDKRIEDREREKNQVGITRFYDPYILNAFDPNAYYIGWTNEGISDESMRKFNIRYYWGESHIIIPHYDIDGNLVGIRRRSLNPEDSKNKYMPETYAGVSYEHPLGLNLYGLYENKEALKKYQTAYIVEGEKSVLKSDTFYGDKSVAVATCGFNISDWQIGALLKLGVSRVYLCFDKDYDIMHPENYEEDPVEKIKFKHYLERLEVLATRCSELFNVYIVRDIFGVLGEKDSPFDQGKENFELLKKNAKLFVR